VTEPIEFVEIGISLATFLAWQNLTERDRKDRVVEVLRNCRIEQLVVSILSRDGVRDVQEWNAAGTPRRNSYGGLY